MNKFKLCLPMLALLFGSLLSMPSPAGAVADASYSHYLKALMLEREGNFGAALEEYKNTIALDPGAQYVYQNAIKIALRIGKVDEAQEWSNYLVKKEPGKAENWSLLGGILWARGDIQKASEAYEKALSLDPAEKNALYQYANMVGPSNPQKAIDLFRRYAAAVPEEAGEIHYQIGLIYFDLNKPKDAQENLRMAIRKEPSMVQARYALAHLYEVQGDTAAALGAYLDAETLDPKNASLTARVGEIYMSSGKEAEAESYFRRTVELDKENAGANFWLSVISERRRDFAGALRYIQSSSAYENDASLWLRASYYLTQTGREKDAVRLLDTASKKWPANGEIMYFLALGLDDVGETERALDLLKGLLAAKPDNSDARMQYATMLEKLGRMDEAEPQFRMLLEKSPNDPVLLNYLGYSLADRSMKLPEAEKLIKKAVELAPANGAYIDSLGWLYFKQGKRKESLEQLRKAARLIGDDETVWEHLGEVLQAEGKDENTWSAFKMSQALKPQWDVPPAKLKAVEKSMSPAKQGELTLAHLSNSLTGFTLFGAMAKVEAKAMGRELTFDAILKYRKPDEFNIDIMGPMFTTVCKMKMIVDLNGSKAVSASCGNDDESTAGLSRLAQDITLVLWSYYSGELLKAPAKWDASGFNKKELEFPDHTLTLSDGGSRLAGAEFKDSSLEVSFSNWTRFRGRILPMTVTFEQKGLSVTFRFTKWNAQVEKDFAPVP